MINKRTLRDANLSVSVALPAAAANVTSGSIDTFHNPAGSAGGAGRIDFPGVEFVLEVPATPSLADTKNLTVTLYESDDNVTFTPSPDVPAQTATGAGGAGGNAIEYQAKLPINLKRYIAVHCDVEAAGGDNTALSATLALVF